jgi:hypothetical protein
MSYNTGQVAQPGTQGQGGTVTGGSCGGGIGAGGGCGYWGGQANANNGGGGGGSSWVSSSYVYGSSAIYTNGVNSGNGYVVIQPIEISAPSTRPTVKPTTQPTSPPTLQPTAIPTVIPTVQPTAIPTVIPTVQPTFSPTARPSATCLKDQYFSIDYYSCVTCPVGSFPSTGKHTCILNNVILNAITAASSTENIDSLSPSKALDGDLSTQWISNYNSPICDPSPWIMIKLPFYINISGYSLTSQSDRSVLIGQRPNSWILEATNNSVSQSWTALDNRVGVNETIAFFKISTDIHYDTYRLQFTKNNGWIFNSCQSTIQLYEINLYGLISCPAGQFYSKSGLSCIPCPSGTFSSAWSDMCSACPAGSSSSSGADTCNCYNGFITSGSGTSLICSYSSSNTCPAASTALKADHQLYPNSSNSVCSIQYLVVAGGGGGNCGGGGAGGFLSNENSSQPYNILFSEKFEIVVGVGGVGGYNGATNGANSKFGDISAIGGGHGGWCYNNAPGGGSGGGGGVGLLGGPGITGQGFNGGNNYGGGGGAGGPGADNGAVGGIGKMSCLGISSGKSCVFYAGGGGGGYGASGGEGGGGGGTYSGVNGLGGGGGGNNGGGGSGIVIIQFPTTDCLASVTGIAYTQSQILSNSGDYFTVLKFSQVGSGYITLSNRLDTLLDVGTSLSPYPITTGSGVKYNGHALQFDGSSNAWVSFGSSVAFGGSAFSISVWAMYSSFSQSWSRIFDFQPTHSTNVGVFISHQLTSPSLGFALFGDGNFIPGKVWTLNEFNHFVLSCTPPSNCSVYFNGAFVRSYIVPMSSMTYPYVAGLGKSSNDNERDGYLQGQIADFRLFFRALTSDEVYAIYSGHECHVSSCSAGQFYSMSSFSCLACPTGSNSTSGKFTCACEDGYISSGYGDGLTCKLCHSGEYLLDNSCAICPIGSSSRARDFTCTCFSGLISTGYGSSLDCKVYITFNYTGDYQVFSVPEGTTHILVNAYGASAYEGLGGFVSSVVDVLPSQRLFVIVGGHGGLYDSTGGYNGGGASHGGGGGGASDIRNNLTDISSRLVVAGGGGGGGWQLEGGVGLSINGGSGGGLVGGSGFYMNNGSIVSCDIPNGGTQRHGGNYNFKHFGAECFAGGLGYGAIDSHNKSFRDLCFSLSNRNALSAGGLGGGGGGYYGGGWGSTNNICTGGGGSSYSSGIFIHNEQGVNHGHGYVSIYVAAQCVANEYFSANSLECSSCPVSSYSHLGAFSCTCYDGFISKGYNDELQCLCPFGNYLSSVRSTCKRCPAGSFSSEGATTCNCSTGYAIFGEGDSLVCTVLHSPGSIIASFSVSQVVAFYSFSEDVDISASMRAFITVVKKIINFNISEASCTITTVTNSANRLYLASSSTTFNYEIQFPVQEENSYLYAQGIYNNNSESIHNSVSSGRFNSVLKATASTLGSALQ